MRQFGLIGYPLAQSFSKKYFDAKFEKEGLTDCRFDNFPISTIDAFNDLMHDHPDLVGLAVTIPYKQAVIQYLHDDSNLPEGLNACNCIQVRGNKLIGFNTDYVGFEKSFTPLLKSNHSRALVLGNGGATAAVVFVLKKLGIAYEIVSRKLHNQSTLTYSDIDESVMSDHKVIINTTPLGMYPDTNSFPDIPYSAITEDHFLYDLVYNPTQTKFLEKGAAKGATVKNGGDMLVIQAEENWRIWNQP